MATLSRSCATALVVSVRPSPSASKRESCILSSQGAVRAALQYAERYNNNFASVDAAVLTKIQQVVGDSLTANGISSANVTTTVTEFCECSDGTTLSCALTCSGGSYPHAYIKVTADLTYTPFINFANIANSVGLGGGSAGSGSTTLRSSLTARIQ